MEPTRNSELDIFTIDFKHTASKTLGQVGIALTGERSDAAEIVSRSSVFRENAMRRKNENRRDEKYYIETFQ